MNIPPFFKGRSKRLAKLLKSLKPGRNQAPVCLEKKIAQLWQRISTKSRATGDGCIEWTGGLYPNGYGRATIGSGHLRAHRLAWELANGPIPDGLYACHTCDNRKCVNLEHLYLGTPKDNKRDCIVRGRLNSGKGSQNSQAKLTEEQALEILHSKEGNTALGRKYGIGRERVRQIKVGQTWKHLHKEADRG